MKPVVICGQHQHAQRSYNGLICGKIILKVFFNELQERWVLEKKGKVV